MFNERLITRREALQQLSAGTLLALGLWPGALRAAGKGNSGSFQFIAINDTHYQSADCGRWLEAVVRQMKTHGPIEFCLHAGDLSDNGRRSDFAAVRDIFKGLGVLAHFVIGNHDYINEKFASAEPKPSALVPVFSPKDERRWLPNSQGATIAADGTAKAPPTTAKASTSAQFDRSGYEQFFPKLNYYFKHRGWQVIGLDSSMGTLADKTTIQPHTLRWVDDHLPKMDKQEPTIIFTHFPMGPTVKYRPLNADALLERFKSYNLQAVFCGHWHGFSERQLGSATLTTNRCCALIRGNHDGTKEKGYFLCTAKDGKISREFVEFKPKV